MTGPRLIFVYNADGGLLNALRDAWHKAVSPETYECSLCAITYGAVSMQPDWKKFVAAYPYPSVFMHRDEFRAAFPSRAAIALPVVLLEEGGRLFIVVGSDAIDGCSLPELDHEVRLGLGLVHGPQLLQEV